jgi:hypothetical protein
MPPLVQGSHWQALDFYLISRTFLVSNYLTVADVVMYAALHPIIVSFWLFWKISYLLSSAAQ